MNTPGSQNTDQTYDAVIIGAGHNGLAAAIVLAEAGQSVVVLEGKGAPGGAVKTEEVTLPGYRHDLMATNLNLFAGSPFFARYGEELMARGFGFAPTDRPVCSLFPDGGYLGLTTDLEQTVAGIAELSTADADAFRAMRNEFDRVAPHLFPLLGVPLPSTTAMRRLWSAARALGRGWPLEFGRMVSQSPRQFVEDHFSNPRVQAMFAAWGMHLDFAPSVGGGAMFPFLETMASQANGMVLGAGGADTLITSMISLLNDLGGTVVCDSPVDRVVVEDGRASGVVSGETHYGARKSVVANITPTQLFTRLVAPEHLDEGFIAKAKRFRYGPGTVMIHLALSDPAPWLRPEAADHTYVHIGPYMEDMDKAYSQATSGLIPERPTLVVGQPTVPDPSRAPEGGHILWIQARMFPGEIIGDAGAEIEGTDWAEVSDAVADRIMAQLEEYCPGLGANVLARHVITPADLEAANPNLVGGDSLGGSHHLMQNFVFRPFPGWSRYRTPVKDLYMCGASTWPGAGLGAGSGFMVGQMLSGRRRR